ncbi:MAG: M23 family metallopeptidase [Alphaproteobacteria bacterium]
MGIVGLAFGVLYLSATGYLILRDDMLLSSLTQQIELRRTYEERIAVLRSDVDRLTSRNLLARQSMDAELGRLRHRQAALDARQDVIASLSQAARGAGIELEVLPRKNPDEARLAPRRGASVAPGLPNQDTPVPLDSMDDVAKRLAGRQDDFTRAVGSFAAEKTRKLTALLTRIGVQADPLDHTMTASVGGPFIPTDGQAETEAFRVMVTAAAEDISRYEQIATLARSVPYATPLTILRVSSRFGRRMDPFLRKPAMHNGLDYKAPAGRVVLATAPGVVTQAGHSGGYGKMIEIEHGNGLKTRFAHLKRIHVRKGQQVDRGDRIGAVGSTGRSTGPHLHYEIRRNDKPVDPAPYVAVGREIHALL